VTLLGSVMVRWDRKEVAWSGRRPLRRCDVAGDKGRLLGAVGSPREWNEITGSGGRPLEAVTVRWGRL
jgi:hypothetical protein